MKYILLFALIAFAPAVASEEENPSQVIAAIAQANQNSKTALTKKSRLEQKLSDYQKLAAQYVIEAGKTAVKLAELKAVADQAETVTAEAPVDAPVEGETTSQE